MYLKVCSLTFSCLCFSHKPLDFFKIKVAAGLSVFKVRAHNAT